LLAGLVSVALLQPLAVAAAATHTVAIDSTSFAPATLTVKRGDRVVWKNADPFPHTATASNKAFDSKAIAAGASWSWVAAKPGRFDYVCTFHPNMKATLVVE